MLVIKVILKILVLPLVAVLTLLKWIGIFLTSFSGFFFYLISGLFFLITVASFAIGLCTGRQALTTIAVGFCFFVTPFIAEWLLKGIAKLNCNLIEFIKS